MSRRVTPFLKQFPASFLTVGPDSMVEQVFYSSVASKIDLFVSGSKTERGYLLGSTNILASSWVALLFCFQTVQFAKEIDWILGHPPPSKPKCGFNEELCQFKPGKPVLIQFLPHYIYCNLMWSVFTKYDERLCFHTCLSVHVKGGTPSLWYFPGVLPGLWSLVLS